MILLNILDKALSGGLSALLVFIIYWGVTSLFRRLNNGKETIPERQNNFISEENQVESKSTKQDSSESVSALSDVKNILVKFNYFYSFKWIPECIDTYNSGKGSILKSVDIVSINKLHPEYSSISRRIEYALSKYKSKDNIKVIAIAMPNSGAISEVEVGYIVFDEKKQRSIYFTLERSFNGEYAVVSPDAKGNRSLYGTVKNHSAFVELALSIAFKRFEAVTGSHDINNAVDLYNQYEDAAGKETTNSYDYETLTGIAKSRVIGELTEIIKAASDLVNSKLGQVPLVNESLCYLFCSSFLCEKIPSKFLLEVVNEIRAPFFNEWTQRSVLAGIEKLNETLPKSSIPLVDFAQVKGNMRIEIGIRIDGQYGKYATFKKSNDELSMIEALIDLPEENIKADKISKIRNQLRVKQQDGIYRIYHISEDDKTIVRYNQRIYYLLYTDSLNRVKFGEELPKDYLDYVYSDTELKNKVESIYNLSLEVKNRVLEQAKLLGLIR